jgi:hypothetical protein
MQREDGSISWYVHSPVHVAASLSLGYEKRLITCRKLCEIELKDLNIDLQRWVTLENSHGDGNITSQRRAVHYAHGVQSFFGSGAYKKRAYLDGVLTYK